MRLTDSEVCRVVTVLPLLKAKFRHPLLNLVNRTAVAIKNESNVQRTKEGERKDKFSFFYIYKNAMLLCLGDAKTNLGWGHPISSQVSLGVDGW
jgi:hypothetical protein